jgi:hypothetical protein
MNEKILAIASHLADRVKEDKRPYSYLRWLVECCDHQYHCTKSELIEAHFAAINILKQNGVENAKRKPLSDLSIKQKQQMRKQAKEFAAMLAKYLNVLVTVERSPIKVYADGEPPRIQILVTHGRRGSGSYIYPSFEELKQWAELNEADKFVLVYKFAQRFKTVDKQINDNIETIKARLESSL